MELAILGQAIAVFVATNVDDLALLTLFFGQARGRRDRARIVLGQYLGYGVLVAASLAAALGLTAAAKVVIPYLGLVPLLIGLWGLGTAQRTDERDLLAEGEEEEVRTGLRAVRVAAITVANGGDDLAIYVPVFAAVGPAETAVLATVFFVAAGVWCALGIFLARRRPIAAAMDRAGHWLMPVVLIALGVVMLAEGAS